MPTCKDPNDKLKKPVNVERQAEPLARLRPSLMLYRPHPIHWLPLHWLCPRPLPPRRCWGHAHATTNESMPCSQAYPHHCFCHWRMSLLNQCPHTLRAEPSSFKARSFSEKLLAVQLLRPHTCLAFETRHRVRLAMQHISGSDPASSSASFNCKVK
jgi:hypothetical protein